MIIQLRCACACVWICSFAIIDWILTNDCANRVFYTHSSRVLVKRIKNEISMFDVGVFWQVMITVFDRFVSSRSRNSSKSEESEKKKFHDKWLTTFSFYYISPNGEFQVDWNNMNMIMTISVGFFRSIKMKRMQRKVRDDYLRHCWWWWNGSFFFILALSSYCIITWSFIFLSHSCIFRFCPFSSRFRIWQASFRLIEIMR